VIVSAYELKRTLKSKAILVIVPIMIALTALIAYSTLSLQVVPAVSVNPIVKGDTLYVYVFAYSKTTGTPISGLPVNVTYHSIKYSGSTNSSGVAVFKFNYYNEDRNVIYSYSYLASTVTRTVTVKSDYSAQLDVIPVGENIVRIVAVFVTSGDKGSLSIYYRFITNTTDPSIIIVPDANRIRSNYEFLANVSQYFQTLELKLPNSSVGLIVYGVYDNSVIPGIPLLPGSIPSNLSISNTYSILAPIASLIPLMVLILSYSLYAKDKYSGVLEFLMAKPVTRAGLLLTRYFGIGIGSVIATLIAIGITALVATVIFGVVLSPFGILVLTLTIIAELLALLGFFMLIAQLVPSSGLYLGITIGIWIIFNFFYSLIIALVYIYTENSMLLNILYYINIVNYYDLVGTLIGVRSLIGAGTLSIFTDLIYVTTPAVLVSLIIWVILPIFLATQLVRRRD